LELLLGRVRVGMHQSATGSQRTETSLSHCERMEEAWKADEAYRAAVSERQESTKQQRSAKWAKGEADGANPSVSSYHSRASRILHLDASVSRRGEGYCQPTVIRSSTGLKQKGEGGASRAVGRQVQLTVGGEVTGPGWPSRLQNIGKMGRS